MSKFDTKLKAVTKSILEMAYGADPNAQSITSQELAAKISGIAEADKVIKFTSVTIVTGRKKDPETGEKVGNVYKVSQVEAKMNVDYQAKRTEVGREVGTLGPEDQHELGRTYGEHETATIINHLGKQYLQVVPTNALSPQFVIQSTTGEYTSATKEQVAPYLRPPSAPADAGAERVPIRRYQLSSIVSIEIDGQDYKISDISEDRAQVLNLVDANPDRE